MIDNNKLEELANKADIGWDDKYHWYVSNAELRKFAQVVACECAAVCDGYGMPDGTSSTAIVLAAAIRQHFGIKNEIQSKTP
jgi:hypothetical protein